MTDTEESEMMLQQLEDSERNDEAKYEVKKEPKKTLWSNESSPNHTFTDISY